MKTTLQAATTTIIGFAAFLLMVFWPAGTFDYWQGWAFIAVFAAATTIPSIYLAATNPAALKRRMQAGPAAETRLLQKVIISVAFVSMAAILACAWSLRRNAMCSAPGTGRSAVNWPAPIKRRGSSTRRTRAPIFRGRISGSSGTVICRARPSPDPGWRGGSARSTSP